ncbi:phosphatidate cytidylyltransferase [Candidatus Poribacteria bacterium]
MFWTRVLSALFFGFLVIVVVQSGPWVLFGVVSLVVVLSAIEFSRLAKATGGWLPRLPNILVAVLICLSSFKPDWIDINLVLCVAIALPFLIEIIRRDPDSALLNVSSALLGTLYAGWLFGRHLLLLSQMPNGAYLIFFLMGIAWSGDIGAYLIGRRFGKHKIIPAISPGKSLEGYIAGTAFSCATALALRYWLLPDMRLLHTIILGIGLALVGQIGDLAESLLKRGANVKDSGSLMPGHGGILDRCDSLIFITPALYYYVRLISL